MILQGINFYYVNNTKQHFEYSNNFRTFAT